MKVKGVMNVQLGFAITLGLLAFTLAPAEAEAKPCNSKGCSSTIATLYVASSVYVAPKDGGQSNLNCTPKSGVYLTLKKTHASYKEIYSALLSAAMTKRAITMRIVDGSNGCDISYIKISN